MAKLKSSKMERTWMSMETEFTGGTAAGRYPGMKMEFTGKTAAGRYPGTKILKRKEMRERW